jgi:hypothetical protein
VARAADVLYARLRRTRRCATALRRLCKVTAKGWLIEGISRSRRLSIASFVDDMESEAHAKIFRSCGWRQPDRFFHAGVRRS